MRKTLILLGMLFISFILVACDGELASVTPPSFVSFRVDGTNPEVDGELVTYYKGKSDVILIEVNISNPDLLLITSINIDGYNYFASRFTEESTRTTIYFEMSAGTQLGEKVLSLDEIAYKNGDISEKVLVSSNNEFNRYVFKTMPTVEREDGKTVIGSDSITVEFDIQDLDEVIVDNTLVAELYSGETLVGSKILTMNDTEVVFESLLSNKNYEVEVKANFDLDDNDGFRTNVVLYSAPFTTKNNSLPNASIINPEVTSNSIVFEVVYQDENEVTKDGGISVGVYLEDVMVDEIFITGSEEGVTILGLLNDNEYTLKVLSDYDLLDGHLTITDSVLSSYTFTTLPRDLPVPNITNLTIEENRIYFNFEIDDPDGLIDKDTIEILLYIDGEFKESISVNEYVFEFQVNNLFANTSFLISVEASVNLNDGAGWIEDEVIYFVEGSTNENEVPIVYVSDLIVTQGYITVDVEVIDDDETINGTLTAILYEVYKVGEVEFENEVSRIQFDSDADKLVFSHLSSYLKGYRIDIIADYDLIDGTEPKVEENLFKSVTITSERKPPAVELNDAVFTTETISLNVNLMDSDNTIIADSMIIYLLLGGVLVPGSQQVLVVGNNPILFTGLLSNNEYEVVVEVDYTYDLAEDSVVLLSQELTSETTFTLEKVIPTAEISEVFSETESLSFNVNVIDEFSTIDDTTLIAALYLNDVYQSLFETVDIGANFAVSFTGLLSDKQYEIRIMTEYDLNDGNVYVDVVELSDYFIYTQKKAIPSYNALNVTSTQDNISFDVEIIDVDDVILSNLVAKLYIGDTYTTLFEPLVVGNNSGIEFDVVFSDERYNIRISADFDFNDDSPVQLGASMTSEYINTLPNAILSAEIDLESIVETKNSILFDVEVTDENTVLTDNLQAVLYDNLGVAVPGKIEALVVGSNTNVEFTGLQSESDYTIRIEADYDLNEEANAEVLAGSLDTASAQTLSLTSPSATLTIDFDTTKNTRINFEAFVTDDDSTITTLSTLKAVLYDMDGVQVGLPVDLAVGDNTGKFFDELNFGEQYEIRIETDYDLNNGQPDIIGSVLAADSDTTKPLIAIDALVEDKRVISFNLEINDEFGILLPLGDNSVVEVVVRDENDLQVGDTYFIDGTTNFELVNLWSNYSYYIEVTADYNVGNGNEDDKIVFTQSFATGILEEPEIEIVLDHAVLESGTNITFEVIGISDVDGIISGFVDNGVTPGTLEAVLYIDGAAEVTVIPLPADGIYTFPGYDGTDGRDYAIVIQATVDLNEDAVPLVGYDFITKSWIWADKN